MRRLDFPCNKRTKILSKNLWRFFGAFEWFGSVSPSERDQTCVLFCIPHGLIECIRCLVTNFLTSIRSVRSNSAASAPDFVLTLQVAYDAGLRRFLYQNQPFRRDEIFHVDNFFIWRHLNYVFNYVLCPWHFSANGKPKSALRPLKSPLRPTVDRKVPLRPMIGRKVPLRPTEGRRGHSFDFYALGRIVSEFAIKIIIVSKKIVCVCRKFYRKTTFKFVTHALRSAWMNPDTYEPTLENTFCNVKKFWKRVCVDIFIFYMCAESFTEKQPIL